MGKHAEDYVFDVHFYDPDNLPGYRQMSQPFHRDDGRIATQEMRVSSIKVEIHGELYIIPLAYIDEDDLVVVPGVTPADL